MDLNPPPFSRFAHDGLEIAYFDEGDPSGDPILLIHGFASSANVNWVFPGWLKTLGDAGYRVIALDNRGHGQSSKPHDPSLYHPPQMAGDAAALLVHLGIGEAHVMGYSMGARISAFLALQHPDRVRSLVFGGLGIGMITGGGGVGSDRRRAACAFFGGRYARAGPDVPRLRRPDEKRSSGARRMHIDIAGPAYRRRGRPHRRAGADRRRDKG
ncbi:alpha/beta fold hydrolase [Sinorhizobium meliloti]